MINALVALLLATQPGSSPEQSPYLECTAARLQAFVRPTGVSQAWPVAASLPAELAEHPGRLLSDQGNVADGYAHWLVVSTATRSAYVIERGGFAGTQKVYGPLPVAVCKLAP
jgi:hypothetical protein